MVELRTIRYRSIRVCQPFVPTVQWACGHRGFVPDYMVPGLCRQCGAEFDLVDMRDPDVEAQRQADPA
jgi:hypothetical protein